MKLFSKSMFVVGLSALGLLFAGCSSTMTPQQMSDMLEKHPEVLANAIEKNPDTFMEAVQKAAQAAQMKAREHEAENEKKRMDDELKNPLKPEIQSERGFIGSASAPITIVEYTDFECPFCGRGYKTLEQVRKTYGDKVKILVKNMPLPMHPMAMPAAKRFEAIRLQSPEKAEKFYHEVFSNQGKLESGQEKYLDSVVKKVGADVAKVQKDKESEKVNARIEADIAEAQKFSITGTPGFIINGVSVRGAYPFETFKTIIDRELAKN